MNQKTILAIALGVSLVLVAQNLSPSLPFVFMGGRSLALPLGVWLFIGFTLGLMTSKAIATIIKWSSSINSQPGKPRGDTSSTKQSRRQPQSQPRDSQKNISFSKSSPSTSVEDWEQPTKRVEEWENTADQSLDQSFSGNDNTFDPPQSPQKRVENVYDTDYRVIIPPTSSPPSPPIEKTKPRDTEPRDNLDWESEKSSRAEDEDWV